MQKLKIVILLSFFICISYTHSYTHGKEVNILVLMTYHQSFPWAASFLAGLNNSRLQYAKRINFYIETMETHTFKTFLSDTEWIDYLLKKYKFIAFDVAIAESTHACVFLYKYRRLLAANIPKIYYTGTGVTEDPLNFVFSTQYEESVKNTLHGVKCADDALYRAKANGRNQVVLWEPA